MTVLLETVDVARPVAEAFDYVRDFTTTTEWDSTTLSAVKLTKGPIVVGTRFEVVCALPIGRMTLTYTVTVLEPDRLIELHGRCRFFEIRDRISFEPSIRGTRLTYRATFKFKPLIGKLASLSRKGLEEMGRESIARLGQALEDNYPSESASDFTRRADWLILPGLFMFSRLGFKLGRKRFNPMSASVKGKHMVVTGATAGLGFATARELARRGAELTLIVRNREKAEKAVEEIIAETGNSAVCYQLADLSLLSDVDQLVEKLVKRGKAIDVLINNAGALFNPRAETVEGLEKSYALLLLSPWRLTEGLKPLLLDADGARVINVVSGGMYSQKLDVTRLMNDDPIETYSGSVSYAREKRALMVLTEEWAASWGQEGIVVNAMHPGWADTPGVQTALPQFRRLTRWILRSEEEGADTIVWLAVATEAGKHRGKLFLDREVRTTHLFSNTREDESERRKLMDLLMDNGAPAI